MVARTHANVHRLRAQFPDRFIAEVNTKPSETIPDQTLSIKDLIDRHTRGQTVPQREMQFDSDLGTEDLPDLSKMTKIEKLEYAAALRQGISDYQLNQQQNEIKRKNDEAAREAERVKDAERNKEDLDFGSEEVV